MRLIGMLDSPYVRRVAIALRLLDIPFEHHPLSVFGHFDEFRRVNPVVKAPTLVCDDGTVLMDSLLIIDHLETVAGRRLWPAAPADRLRALRIAGLALAACDKAVQIVYERNLRPADRQHEPWMERVGVQLTAALTALDAELAKNPLAADESGLTQAGFTAAIVWRLLQDKLEQAIPASAYPALAAYCDALERLPAFAAAPPVDTANVSTPGYRSPAPPLS
jgi:glutathione S-transferase